MIMFNNYAQIFTNWYPNGRCNRAFASLGSFEPSRAKPEAKAIVHQHFHAVRAFVDEQVRMVSSRFAEHSHDASEGRIGAGAHVERLYREPGRVNANHFMSSRSNNLYGVASHAWVPWPSLAGGPAAGGGMPAGFVGGDRGHRRVGRPDIALTSARRIGGADVLGLYHPDVRLISHVDTSVRVHGYALRPVEV
jgi:hypothetical protein